MLLGLFGSLYACCYSYCKLYCRSLFCLLYTSHAFSYVVLYFCDFSASFFMLSDGFALTLNPLYQTFSLLSILFLYFFVLFFGGFVSPRRVPLLPLFSLLILPYNILNESTAGIPCFFSVSYSLPLIVIKFNSQLYSNGGHLPLYPLNFRRSFNL